MAKFNPFNHPKELTKALDQILWTRNIEKDVEDEGFDFFKTRIWDYLTLKSHQNDESDSICDFSLKEIWEIFLMVLF